MPLIHAIVLGIVQGLTEFLPVSSSGHLKLVPWLFGWNDFATDADLANTFDVSLHMGTLAGAIAYFRTDLARLARGGLRALRPARRVPVGGGGTVETSVTPAPTEVGSHGVGDDGKLAWLLLASAVPAAVVATLFEDSVVGLGDSEWVIGVLLIVFGLVLLWADRLGGARPADTFSWRDAAVMGMAQAVALAPGVSRSGVTITASRRLGFQRDAAARLSFLMSLPIIAGAGIYRGLDVATSGGVPSDFVPAFLCGMAASGATGWLAVWGTLKLLRTRTFTPFVVYRVVVGAGVIVLAISGLR